MSRRNPALKALPQEAMLCLEERHHAFDDITGLSSLSTRKRRGLTGIEVTLRCYRCSTLAHDLLSTASGEKVTARQYDRSRVYQLALDLRRDGGADGEQATSDEIRFERLARLREHAKTQANRRARGGAVVPMRQKALAGV